MNFVYISPAFPKGYHNFCDRLKKKGVNVLAIGDTPYDFLDQDVKDSVTEYYFVPSMENYDDMIKAVAYFIFHYGRIDYLESNNEYWLAQDAALRTDFHITSGLNNDSIDFIKRKSQMKAFYEKAGVKTARYHLVSTYEKGKKFVKSVGYPVIVKPDNGVGAAHTYKIHNDEELKDFYGDIHTTPYIMEEFLSGSIESFDGIASIDKEILFETSHVFPEPIMEVVNKGESLAYYSVRKIPEDLKKAGHACVKAFPTNARCFHMEFFRLNEDKEGLGKKGDLVGLEVNMRLPGGYTPDMMNYANDIDIYEIYADMIVSGHTDIETKRPYYCVYTGRRDDREYVYTHQDILKKYKDDLVMVERMPDILSDAMGNMNYTARFTNKKDMNKFINFVLKEVQ